MKFSHFAGIALVPLLARLVLFAAFLPQGYQKVFTEKTFDGDAARALAELGVGVPVTGAVVSADSGFTLAAFQVPTGNLQERPPAQEPPAGEP
jgi:uncharacterized membrane protein YphA (DoxX/SURF4 family)